MTHLFQLLQTFCQRTIQLLITIVPRIEPLTNTPAYLAFEQIGARHYDTVIENAVSTGHTTTKDKELSDNQTHICGTSLNP